LSNADNQRIKDQAPAEYEKLIPDREHDEILASHMIPPDALRGSYEDFIKTRSLLLISSAQELIA
jgi:hypothetical protein